MTEDENRKAKSRERMRLYRQRHANDPVYKARIKEEKRKQLAKNPERRKERARIRRARYRAKYSATEEYKAKAIERTNAWREKNAERAKAACKRWAAAHPKAAKEGSARYRARNPNRGRDIYRADPVKGRAVAAARRTRKHQAMPAWVDEEQIQAFYAEARKRSEETGIMWHVDHIVPLKNKLVCGLHVPANLQVITQSENCSKHNRFSVA